MTIIHSIDSISITILMDNSTDFLLTNSSHAIRQQLIKDEKFVLPPPVAEHGFSALIQISEFDNYIWDHQARFTYKRNCS